MLMLILKMMSALWLVKMIFTPIPVAPLNLSPKDKLVFFVFADVLWLLEFFTALFIAIMLGAP